MPTREIRIDVVSLDSLRQMNMELAKTPGLLNDIKEAAEQMQGVFASFNRSAGAAGRQAADAGLKIQQMTGSLNDLKETASAGQGKLLSLGNAAEKTGKSFDIGLTSMLKWRAIGMVFSEAEKVVSHFGETLLDLDRQASRVRRVVDQPFGAIKWDIADEVTKTGASIQDVSEAYYQLGTRIKDIPTLMQAVDTAMNISIGTEGDVRDTTRAMLQIYSQFGDQLDKSAGQAENMRRIGELLTVTWKASAAETNELVGALRYLGPEAEAAKVPLEQVAGILTALTMEGQRGRMAGTEAAQFLTSILKNYNPDLGGIAGKGAYKGLVAQFDLAKTPEGGIDLQKTLENIVAIANRMPTDKAREFLMIVGQTQNAFRFLGTQGVESLKIINDMIEKANQALAGQTHEAEKLRGQMMTIGQEWQRTWTGAIAAISAAADASPLKKWLHDYADRLEDIVGYYQTIAQSEANLGQQFYHGTERFQQASRRTVLQSILGDVTAEGGNLANVMRSQTWQNLPDLQRNWFLTHIDQYATKDTVGMYQQEGYVELDPAKLRKSIQDFQDAIDAETRILKIESSTSHPGQVWSQAQGKFIPAGGTVYDPISGTMRPAFTAHEATTRGGLGHAGAEGDFPDTVAGHFAKAFHDGIQKSVQTPAFQASCAYFVSEFLSEAGVAIDKIGSASKLGQTLAQMGATSFRPHSASDLQSGDVLIYHGPGYGTTPNGYHAAIYEGGGKVWQSSGEGAGHQQEKALSDLTHATAYRLTPGFFGADITGEREKAADAKAKEAEDRHNKAIEKQKEEAQTAIAILDKSIEGWKARWTAHQMSETAYRNAMETIAPAYTHWQARLEGFNDDYSTRQTLNMGQPGPGRVKLNEALADINDRMQATLESTQETLTKVNDAWSGFADLWQSSGLAGIAKSGEAAITALTRGQRSENVFAAPSDIALFEQEKSVYQGLIEKITALGLATGDGAKQVDQYKDAIAELNAQIVNAKDRQAAESFREGLQATERDWQARRYELSRRFPQRDFMTQGQSESYELSRRVAYASEISAEIASLQSMRAGDWGAPGSEAAKAHQQQLDNLNEELKKSTDAVMDWRTEIVESAKVQKERAIQERNLKTEAIVQGDLTRLLTGNRFDHNARPDRILGDMAKQAYQQELQEGLKRWLGPAFGTPEDKQRQAIERNTAAIERNTLKRNSGAGGTFGGADTGDLGLAPSDHRDAVLGMADLHNGTGVIGSLLPMLGIAASLLGSPAAASAQPGLDRQMNPGRYTGMSEQTFAAYRMRATGGNLNTNEQAELNNLFPGMFPHAGETSGSGAAAYVGAGLSALALLTRRTNGNPGGGTPPFVSPASGVTEGDVRDFIQQTGSYFKSANQNADIAYPGSTQNADGSFNLPGASSSSAAAPGVATYANAALGALGIYQQGGQSGPIGGLLGGALTGAEIGASFGKIAGLPGAAFGAAAGGLVGLLGALFDKPKPPQQTNQQMNPAFANAPANFDYWAYEYRATEASGLAHQNIPGYQPFNTNAPFVPFNANSPTPGKAALAATINVNIDGAQAAQKNVVVDALNGQAQDLAMNSQWLDYHSP